MTHAVYQSLLYTALLLFTWKRLQSQGVNFRIGWNLALILMVAVFLGGRLLHVFYEYPSLYFQDPWQFFRIWEGGFVFFGGFALALGCAAAYLMWSREKILPWADFYAPIIAVGYAFGRLGCLIAGCCYGSFCDAPWAIEARHPTQIYAMITEGLLFLYLLKKEKTKPPAGLIFALWLIWHGVGRMIMESYRADFRGSTIAGLSISTWFSLAVFSAGLALYVSLRSPLGKTKKSS